MITDILVAVAIGGVIALLLYFVSSSARSAQKGNAPVAEYALSKKEREQQKQEKEEAKKEAPTTTSTSTTSTKSNAAAAGAEQQPQKKAAAAAAPAKAKSSSPAASAKSNSSTVSSPTSQQESDNKKAKKNGGKKSKKELDAEEEAEMDAFVAQELKRSGNQGIRKEKFEVVNLEDIQAAKEKKAARTIRKAEGAQFTDKQVATEKAAGFRVVGVAEAAKKEARQIAKATKSPTSPLDGDEENGKRRREPMTREEELDAALRSVLSRRSGNKKGGAGGGAGGYGNSGDGFGRRENSNKNATGDVKGVVDIKGEVKASTPGGAWGRTE